MPDPQPSPESRSATPPDLRIPRVPRIPRGNRTAPAVLAAGGLLLAACTSTGKPIDYTVTITYHKAGVCSDFQEHPGTTPQQHEFAGSGVFVLYVVDSIANTASGAKDFTFDTGKAYVVGGGSLAGSPFSNHFTVSTRLVTAGATATGVGWFALNVDGDPTDLQNATDHLVYHSAAGESVLLINQNDSNTVIGEGVCTPNNVP